MAKDSFILYKQHFKQIDLLTMEERGQLLTAILCHVNGESVPPVERTVQMILPAIKERIDFDTAKYNEICSRRTESGKKGAEFGKLGGRPKKDKGQGLESYAQIIEDMEMSAAVTRRVWEFIRHCNLNGHTLTNDKLSNILVVLDMQTETDEEKISLINSAINGGYYDIKRVN